MNNKFIRLVFLVAFLLPLSVFAKVIYVNGSYTGSTENGTSWATPFKTIEGAIAASASNDQIWVAKGTYSAPQDATYGYEITQDLKFYGGFAGNEANIFSRDLGSNLTYFNTVANSGAPIISLRENVKLEIDGFTVKDFKSNVFVTDYAPNRPNILVSDKFYAKFNNCTFLNGAPPAILNYEAHIEVINSKITNCAPIQNSDFFYVWGNPTRSTMKLVNVDVSAPDGDPAPVVSLTHCSLEIIKCNFSGFFRPEGSNTAPVLYSDFTGNIDIQGSTFKNIGRIIGTNLTGSSFKMTDCIISDNNSSTFQSILTFNQANVKVEIDNCKFDNNQGCLLSVNGGDLKLTNTVFSNNTLTALNTYTKMIAMENAVMKTYTIDNCKFINNTNSQSSILRVGGSDTRVIVTNSEFTNNKCTGNASPVEFSNEGGADIKNCKFVSNSSSSGVGAMVIYANGAKGIASLENIVFENNSGTASAGACILNSSLKSAVKNCIFRGNKCVTEAGAISFYGGSGPDFSNCTFEENESINGMGGAIFTTRDANFINCKFLRNKSKDGGGALALYIGNGSNLSNCLFDGNNSGAGLGAAVYGRPNQIQNCTFVNNKGVATFGNSSTVLAYHIVSNSIFWNNTTDVNLITDQYGSLLVSNCDVQGSFPGENNLNVDPQFADFAGGDYRLSCSSPLINMGKNSLAPSVPDLDNQTRIFAGTVDIGAYEFPQDPASVSTPPAVSFTASASVCIAEAISLQNQTTPLQNTRFEWNFGDGNTSTETTPVYSYSKAGTFTITLKATNACGATSQTSKTIIVRPAFAPVITQATSVCPGAVTDFTTDANCNNLVWSVTGGTISSANGGKKITVQWGDGSTGNGRVSLLATNCGVGFCENPVSIEIPIVPVNFQLVGDAKLCQGTIGSYATKIQDKSPATLYTWTVKGGSIIGKNTGYELQNIQVQWSNSTDTLGKVYLVTYNEVLKCGRKDSFIVDLRPKFSINNSVPATKVCSGKQFQYSIVNSYNQSYTWGISGSNTIDNATGLATWGSTAGKFAIYANVVNQSKVCNVTDTLQVEVFSTPVVTAINGALEVDTSSVQSYNAVLNTTGAQVTWTVTGGVIQSNYGNSVTVKWGKTLPFSLTAKASLTNGSGCISAPYTIDIKKDFTFVVSYTPASICIGQSVVFTANEDTEYPTTYKWSTDYSTETSTTKNFTTTVSQPGTRTITLTATRNNKTYTVTQNIVVGATVTDIAVSGPKEIDPQGTGTYKYTVTNSQNIAYTAVVTGGTFIKNGNELTVTWGGTAPFKITVTGAGSPCSGVPAVLEVTKVAPLSNQIVSTGSPCLNSRVTYNFVTDQYTDKLQWTLSGGGTIVSNNNNSIVVEWNKTGSYSIGLQYERFGLQTASLSVNVAGLPTPQIVKGTICGNQSFDLSTTSSYLAYEWYVEPSVSSFSSLAKPTVSVEGLYRVNVTDANGCKSFATTYIDQIPLPQAKIFSEDALGYCVGSGTETSVTLKTYEGADYKYQWYLNGQAIAGETSLAYTKVLSLQSVSSANYTVKISLKSCESTSIPVMVSVYQCGGGTGNPNTCNEPAVGFSINTSCQPFSFTTSSLANDQFVWDFGDGTTSSDKNPAAKKYALAGIYKISLTRLCNSSVQTVEVPASASFKLESPACIGQEAVFKDYSVNLPDRKIISWEWNFGDNTLPVTGSGNGSRDVKHTFNGAGPYIVTLTVKARNKAGIECSHTSQTTITLKKAPEVAFAITPPPCTSNTYLFTNQSTKNSTEASYIWEFGNGQQVTIESPSLTFAAGSQTSKLTVTNSYGCVNSLSKSFTVTNPVTVEKIVVTGDKLLCNGKSVKLTAPAGMELYTWYKGNIQVSQSNTSNSITVSNEGSYKVTYRVSPSCSATTEAVALTQFTVDNLLSGNKKVCVGDAIVINTNLDQSTYSFAWKYNNTVLANSQPSLVIPDTKLSDAGNYTVTVTDKKTACYTSLPVYTIAMYNKPAKPLISTSVPQACYGGEFTLFTNKKAGSTFTWYKDQVALSTATDTSKVLTAIQTGGNYKVAINDIASGCSTSSDNLYVGVASEIILKIKGDTLCGGSALSLDTKLSTNDYSFQWYKNNVLTTNTSSAINIAQLSAIDAGEYYVTAISKGTNNLLGCSATSNKTGLGIKVAPAKPVITGPVEFCSGTSVTLTQNLADNFKWSTGATTPSITVTLGGVYSVTSTNTTSGCQLTTAVTVTQNQLPNVTFVPKGVYARCGSDKISFTGLSAYPVYNWYVDGVKFGASNNNNLYPTKSGKYSLEVFTDKGCVAYSDTMIITALECPCYVTNTNDDGEGSLREALNCSNSKPGKDIIKFVIPGTGPFVIKPLTALPAIADSVFIDGFSQSGSGNYAIVLDGTSYSDNGLKLDYNQANTKISGLTFTNFKNAISLSTLVGNTTIENNTFTSNSVSAIELYNNTQRNTITGNIIQSSGNGIVLVADAIQNTIQKNIISNSKVGVGIYSRSTLNHIYFNEILNSSEQGVYIYTNSKINTVKGNTIGLSAKDGILIDGAPKNIIDSNFVGVRDNGVGIANAKNGLHIGIKADSTIAIRNTFGFNPAYGVMVEAINANIINNYIGVDKAGNNVPNTQSGVYVTAAGTGSIVVANTIANNEYGVYVETGTKVVGNKISNNTKAGIFVKSASNKISRNSITNTNLAVKAIDLHFTALPAGNLGKIPAQFKSYRRGASGIVIKGEGIANDTVEVFVNNNIAQQALLYAGSAKTNALVYGS